MIETLHEGEDRVYEQVARVLQRERRHCRHDVRHQLRIQEVRSLNRR